VAEAPLERVTNPKLTGSDPPEWRPYPGVSLLYDDTAAAGSRGLALLTSPYADRGEPLYGALEHIGREAAGRFRAAQVGYVPLPSRTFHVTLCDGVHRGNHAQVAPAAINAVDAVFDNLPDSLLRPSPVLRLLADPELLWCVWTRPVTLRAGELCVLGSVLGVTVEPADDRSAASLDAHRVARDKLAARWDAWTGLSTQPWRPHVSLGYFANEEGGTHARERLLPGLRPLVGKRARTSSVTFSSASVYGYIDMAAFYRLAT
jgi:hypothetical protein